MIKYWSLAIICFLVLGVSCLNVSDPLNQLPPTRWAGDDAREDRVSRFRLGLHFSNNMGYNSVKTQVPSDIEMIMLDNHFRKVDYTWFREFNNWFTKMKMNNGLMAGHRVAENMDCDNYSMLYKSMMSVAAYKSGATSEPAAALVVVNQVHEFGDIPATGGLHMLVFIITSRGWFMVEPQTGEFVNLQDYPNQADISMMIF